jgi:hypothetical protein
MQVRFDKAAAQFFITGLLGLLPICGLRAETPAPQTVPTEKLSTQTAAPAPAPAPAPQRTLSVLPSTDTSGLNLAGPLQNALGRLFQQAGGVNVQLSSMPLTGFTTQDVRRLHETLGSDLLSLVYLEKTRIALFLFDKNHPNEFVVATQPMTDGNGNPVLTSNWIEHQFRAAFIQLVTDYSKGKMQSLPGTKVDSERLAEEQSDEVKRRIEESRRLFRELASLEDKPFYLGTSIGIARFGGGDGTASTVNLGALAGYKFSPRIRGEAGIDFFNYAMFHLDGKYELVSSQRYLSMSFSLGLARVLSHFSDNALKDTANLSTGAMLFGPGFSMEIPLLGTSIRGDFRLYVGGGSILMGSYGLAYPL